MIFKIRNAGRKGLRYNPPPLSRFRKAIKLGQNCQANSAGLLPAAGGPQCALRSLDCVRPFRDVEWRYAATAESSQYATVGESLSFSGHLDNCSGSSGMNTGKSRSLREIAETTRRASAPAANAIKGR
jgi:hypothetical protein